MTSTRLPNDADNATRKTLRRARRACGFCTRRKIRCDKELPSCSACKLNKRQCSYRKITVQFDEGDEANGKLLIVRNELSPLCSHAEKTRAAIAFLDHGLSLRGPALSPLTFGALSHMPAYIKALVGDHGECQQISARYYKMIHPWLPIVSKKKVYDHILNPLAQPRVDTAFLLLCMKILASSEERVNPCTAEYQAAVQLDADVQSAGIISAEVLQGCILLAVYEQGHAMYPAAHVRVGACLKYAAALSMGWERSRNSCPQGGVWVEEEEEVRTWWAIYLLERIGAIGHPRQSLAIPEPDMTAQLPCTDQDWNNQVSSQTPSTLSSPPETLGRYASVVQSGYLLSRVFRHATDTSASSEFQRLEVEQLERTLYALIRYSESNEGTLYQITCYQTAISFCALLLLYAPYMEHQAGQLYESAKSVLDTAAMVSLQVTREYLSTDELNLTYGDIPPFVVPWLYKMAVWFLQDGQKDNFKIIESALRKLDRRWKSAGTCLELLAARRVMASVPT